VTRYRLIKKDTLSASARAAALPVAFDDVDLDLLVEMLLPQSELRSRTQLRMQLEDAMAAALEQAMRGERAAFMDIYEYVPGDEQPGGVFAVTRVPGQLLREIAETHCFVLVDDDEATPEIVLVRDKTTGTVNELLTPGGVLQIEGMHLQAASAPGAYRFVLIDVVDLSEWPLATVEASNAIPQSPIVEAVCLQVSASLPGGYYELELQPVSKSQNARRIKLDGELRAQT